MKNILLAGGSGLIGSHLTGLLLEKNYAVAHLSRQPGGQKGSVKTFHWHPATGEIDPGAIEWADAVVNLAGAGIADKRWTASRKKEVMGSRVQSTLLLKKAIEQAENRPAAYLGASATGFYGNRGDEILDESSAPGHGFLTEVCLEWERAHAAVAPLVGRAAVLRIGIVLSKKGGALPELLRPIKLGAAAYFGDGRAFYPWVHIDDVCRQFLFVLENENCSGVFNAVGLNPLTIKDLSKKLAVAMGRGWAPQVPVPAFLLRLVLGEMADCVLNSARVLPKRFEAMGFRFLHEETFVETAE